MGLGLGAYGSRAWEFKVWAVDDSQAHLRSGSA